MCISFLFSSSSSLLFIYVFSISKYILVWYRCGCVRRSGIKVAKPQMDNSAYRERENELDVKNDKEGINMESYKSVNNTIAVPQSVAGSQVRYLFVVESRSIPFHTISNWMNRINLYWYLTRTRNQWERTNRPKIGPITMRAHTRAAIEFNYSFRSPFLRALNWINMYDSNRMP